MRLRKRRAVGGLISLIGIIVVFGIVSVAYLELSSAQTNLISTSLVANQKMSDKNNARLNFTSTPIVVGSHYDLPIDNIGSNTITIHSYIVNNNTNHVIGTGEIDISINAGNDVTVSTSDLDNVPTGLDTIMIITDSGKKCIIPADVSYRLC